MSRPVLPGFKEVAAAVEARKYWEHMTREQLIDSCIALSDSVHELAARVQERIVREAIRR